MLVPAIVVDATMTAAAVLERLAVHGYWLDPADAGARERLAAHVARTGTKPEVAAERLRRHPSGAAVAIRAQRGANVLWHWRRIPDVLEACLAAVPGRLLGDVLALGEDDDVAPVPLPSGGDEPVAFGVVLDGGAPVAVSVPRPAHKNGGGARSRPPEPGRTAARGFGVGAGGDTFRGGPMAAPPVPARVAVPPRPGAAAAPSPERVIEPWPRVKAPAYVPATVAFDVTVGFAEEKQSGLTGGRMAIEPPPGAATVDVDVDLVADGLDAPDGWTRRLTVAVDDPWSASVTFRLVGRVPAGPEPCQLTSLLVRYVYAGAVCGTASRPLVVGQPTAKEAPAPGGPGTPWSAQPATASAVALVPDALAPDLTIELAKPDGNPAAGRFKCLLSSPHGLSTAAGPFDVDLGEDAKTFARKCVVDQIATWDGGPLADDVLEAIGALVRDQLPPQAMDALREVADRVKPEPPAVLVVTAEPFVPWELALVDPPLDPDKPPFLGAQALVGRWIRDPAPAPAPPPAGAAPRRPKPPPSPPSRLAVRNMAVMAGAYAAGSGLRPLPGAKDEADRLVEAFGALRLDATPQAVSQLLGAKLPYGTAVCGAEAMHFAGHGDFDPEDPDASAFYLSNGKPLGSLLFRNAKYGDAQQPLAFLNACMIGVGGELLGDMGGFPGNCLKGGFGGLLGALWAVNDRVASEFAVEFWTRVLPRKGSTAGAEPVGKVLRDLRARYAEGHPTPTYLAYVFYGHPRLTLVRE